MAQVTQTTTNPWISSADLGHKIKIQIQIKSETLAFTMWNRTLKPWLLRTARTGAIACPTVRSFICCRRSPSSQSYGEGFWVVTQQRNSVQGFGSRPSIRGALVEGRERWWSPRLYNKERGKNVRIDNGLIVSSLSSGLISTRSKGGMVWISVSISLLNSNACIDNATGGWKTYQIPDP